MRIKLSGVISDLLGVSGRRILTALSQGETDAVKLAELGDERLQCSKEALADALRGSPAPLQLAVLQLFLERLAVLDHQIQTLDTLIAQELKKHEEAVIRVAELPGFGVDSARQIIAEVGVEAETFPSADAFASWFGGCPGSNISAEQNHAQKLPQALRKLGYTVTLTPLHEAPVATPAR
jgi:transposase